MHVPGSSCWVYHYLRSCATLYSLLGCALLGTAFQFVAIYLHQPWLALVLVAAFAALAVFTYSKALQHIGPYLLQHRETLLEELSRKT